MIPQGENYLAYADASCGKLEVITASYGPGGRGARVAHTIASSPFGLILIAATSSGVCWLGIHDSAAYLEAELQRDFSRAAIVHGDDELRELAIDVVAFICSAKASLRLPVDIRATPFQLAVWRELCAIPPGATRSYGEIAGRVGRPRAARAVGHANGSNPLAILIPCHRAVGAGGRLTGYRWGCEYKRRLLEHERFALGTGNQQALNLRNSRDA